MSKAVDVQRAFAVHMRRFARAMEAIGDAARLATDAFIRAERREWEFPEHVLTDDDRDEIDARQLKRTLDDIDDLPTR